MSATEITKKDKPSTVGELYDALVFAANERDRKEDDRATAQRKDYLEFKNTILQEISSLKKSERAQDDRIGRIENNAFPKMPLWLISAVAFLHWIAPNGPADFHHLFH